MLQPFGALANQMALNDTDDVTVWCINNNCVDLIMGEKAKSSGCEFLSAVPVFTDLVGDWIHRGIKGCLLHKFGIHRVG